MPRWLVALSGTTALALTALAANHWAQRSWLERKWLYKEPRAFEQLWGFALLAVCAAAATFAAARRRRGALVAWPSLRWLPIALAAAWVWLWCLPRPILVFDAQLALSGVGAAWCALVALGAWSSRSGWPRAVLRIELVALGLALSLFASELLLRTWRAFAAPQVLATAGTDVAAWLRAHRRTPGTFHIGFPVDSAGFVDDEPTGLGPQLPWIACIGDSFSVGVVPHHRHYTTLAEAPLGMPVYNIGVVNAGPREYAQLIRAHAVPRAPRLIVVALFMGNDVLDAQRGLNAGLESWIDPDEALVRVTAARIAALAASESREGLAGTLYGIRADERVEPAELERRLTWLADPLTEPEALTRERFLYVEHTRTGPLASSSAESYAALFASLRRVHDAARPIPLAFLLFPDEFQVEDALWRALESEGLPADVVRDRPQREVGAFLEREGLLYIDLLPRCLAVAPLADGERHLFHRHDTHFNARGNELAARALVELVERCSR